MPVVTVTRNNDSPAEELNLTNNPTYAIPKRPLAVILAWMMAKEKHLEKYRQFYFRRGLDVLTVCTSPIDLLLPPIGAQLVAKRLIEFLSQINAQYSEIIFHAFSVGAYQWGEVLVELQRRDEIDGQVANSIKGLIIDSMCHVEEAAPGLSKAITKHFIVQPLLELSIDLFLKVSYPIATKNYLRSSNEIFRNVLKVPGLLLFSKNDEVSNYKANQRLFDTWQKSGYVSNQKCWDQSTHVGHYIDHPVDYESNIDHFLSKLSLSSGCV